MRVSRSSVKVADKVKKQGVPQLVNAVAAGKLSVSAAAGIVGLPAEHQQAVVAAIESGLKPKQALAQIRDTGANDRTCPKESSLPSGSARSYGRRASASKPSAERSSTWATLLSAATSMSKGC